jgi:hypothetical protein
LRSPRAPKIQGGQSDHPFFARGARTRVLPCSLCCAVNSLRKAEDTATKKCTIVNKKLTTTTVVLVGPMAFKTRAEAEAGMKTIAVCTSN